MRNDLHLPVAMQHTRALFQGLSIFLIGLLWLLPNVAQAQVTMETTGDGSWSDENNWRSSTTLTGNITASTGSISVTGSGTLFDTQLTVGSIITKNGGAVIGTVASIQSNTALTLVAGALSNHNNNSYRVIRVPTANDAVDIIQDVTIPSGFSAVCASLRIGTQISGGSMMLSFDAASSALTVGGNVMIFGPGNNNNRELRVNAGTMTVGGNLTIGQGQNNSQENRVSAVIITTGTLTVDGNLSFVTGTLHASENTSLQAQIQMNGSGVFNLKGSFTLSNGIGTLTMNSAAVFNYNGASAAQSVLMGALTDREYQIAYSNLHLNNTNTNGATLSAAITGTNVTGDLKVQSGTFNNGAFPIALSTNDSFIVSNGATFILGGTTTMVTVSGTGAKTFGATSTTNYNGGIQTVTAETYGNLGLRGGDVKIMPVSTTTVARNLTIAGAGTSVTANASINVGGKVTINNSGTYSAGSFVHTVGGDWENNANFDAGTSHIIFNTASSKLIYGASANTFYDLTLDATNGATVNDNSLTVNHDLTLLNGTLRIGNHDLTINPGGTILGGFTTAYVRTNGTGVLRQTVADQTVVFHVGVMSYNPAVLNNTGGTPDIYSVRVVDNVFDEGSAGDFVTENVVGRTWFVEEDVAGDSHLDMMFQWNIGDELEGFTANACYISHYMDGGWQANTMANGSARILSITDVTSLSPFAIGSNGALPIELIAFSATADKQKVLLDWSTATEINNEYFSIERSNNGRDFVQIGKIDGAGTSYQRLDYTFTDAAPLQGWNYYRLQQMDYDGHFSYSPIEAVLMDGKAGTNDFLVFPNPVEQALNLKMNRLAQATDRLEIFNATGQLVLSVKLTDALSTPTDVSALPAGAYLARVRAADGSTTTSFVKQ